MSILVISTSKYVPYENFIDLMEFKYIAVSMFPTKTHYKRNFLIEKLFFYKCYYEQFDNTWTLHNEIEVRVSDYWEDKIGNIIKNETIPESRPDGIELFHNVFKYEEEGYQNKNKGHDNYKYYSLSELNSYFKDSFFQRVDKVYVNTNDYKRQPLYFENGIYERNKLKSYLHDTLLLFSFHEIRKATLQNEYPFILMSMDRHEYKTDNRQKEFHSNEFNREFLKEIKNPDIWQDNPGDFWNID